MRSVSVVLITQDEEDRIANAIRSCSGFADEVVVIDGGSRDSTSDRARELGCRVFVNPWPGYARQRTFGVERAIHPWVFLIDSDEVVGEDLASAIRSWKHLPSLDADAFAVCRVGDFFGKWLDTSGGEYLVRLYNRTVFQIEDVPVHEKPDVGASPVGKLPGTLWHHGFRSMSNLVVRFNRYTDLEAEKADLAGRRFSLLRLLTRPPARFLHRYVWQRMYRKGITGLAVAMLWSYYEFLREIKLYEIRWRRRRGLPAINSKYQSATQAQAVGPADEDTMSVMVENARAVQEEKAANGPAHSEQR
jgi:glycosyltransferase involved in cell wall biosynthesis